MTDEAVTSEQIQRDLLVLIGLMQQREERMRDTVNQQMQALQVGVQRAGGEVNRVVESAMPRLSQLSQQALAGALDPAAQRLEQSVQNASRTLLAATQNYAQAQQQLAYKASRGMLLATMAVGLAGLLAAAAGAWLLLHARQEVARLQPQIDYFQAINHADWVMCGEGRLCARVEERGQRYGADKGYRRIEIRQ